MVKSDAQMDIIAEYYMVLGDYSPNEKRSDNYSRVYTSPDTSAWLVLQRKGDNIIQARHTDEVGIILSWDNYATKNGDMQLVEATRLAADGRKQIVFTPLEVMMIDRYGDHDRNVTIDKLDTLLGRFMDPDIEAAAKSLIDKLAYISDQSYADMYSVGQRRQELRNGI